MRKIITSTLCVLFLLCFVSCDWLNPKEPEASTPPSTVHVTSISLSPTTLYLSVGQSQALTVTITPSDATDKTVTWSSESEDIVVDNDGNVTLNAQASGFVTVRTNDGGYTAACMVIASPSP